MSEYKTEYKVGDRLRIRHGIESPLQLKEQLENTDHVVEYHDKHGDGYLVRRDDLQFVKTDDILGYAFKPGQKIEVSENGEGWHKGTFIAYNELNGKAMVEGIVADDVFTAWKYARPIPIREPEFLDPWQPMSKMPEEEEVLVYIEDSKGGQIRDRYKRDGYLWMVDEKMWTVDDPAYKRWMLIPPHKVKVEEFGDGSCCSERKMSERTGHLQSCSKRNK